jgi:tetratricopeptide (TPR) repeat protein
LPWIILLGSAADGPAQPETELSRHARLAQAAIKANDTVAAESELNAMLKLDPGNVDAHANLGMLKFLEGNYFDAASEFKTTLASSPSLWSAQAFLGLCDARLGNPAGALTLLETSLPHLTDPTLLKQSSLELARLYSESGALEKAAAVIENLARSRPTDPEVLYTKYRLHSEIAAEALRQMMGGGSDSPWLHEVYGQSYMAQEQYASAIREFQKAIELGPQISGLHYQLGEALLLSERSESKRAAAEQEFRQELKRNPQDANCMLKLADIALERSRIGEAKSLVARALSIRGDNAEAHVTRARIMELEGDVSSAITELETAEKLAPDTKTTYYQLGTLYRRQGRQAEASRQLQVFQRLALAERTSVRLNDTVQ